ncbi:hypothetical protein PGTUg99_015639 [Puccinia graminis f. sp. tritici]|uniref:Uncharacterized protein n=1 Tax=Puccinia graminis f. sp. tritici TaxID=56615 RepID=A0A5B0RJZ6_PUCGR|nr:hypothetical protein PGTUg99_015639 [Puccinia graminis f. sp. tritici]
MTSQSTSPEKLDELIRMSEFDVVSSTLAEQLMVEERPFQCHDRVFWRPYEAFVYVHDKYIDQQREAGLEINHPEIVRLAMYDVFCGRCSQRKPMREAIRADKYFLGGRHKKPDLLSVPPRTAREALLENWHRYAQCVAWTCADIVRNFTNDHLITSD